MILKTAFLALFALTLSLFFSVLIHDAQAASLHSHPRSHTDSHFMEWQQRVGQRLCHGPKSRPLFCADLSGVIEADGDPEAGFDPLILKWSQVSLDSEQIKIDYPRSPLFRFNAITLCRELVKTNWSGSAQHFVVWDVKTASPETPESIQSLKCMFTQQ